jgi:hypothetical protein
MPIELNGTVSDRSKSLPINSGVPRPSVRSSISALVHDLIPREMIAAYAVLKKAAAEANRASGPIGRNATSEPLAPRDLLARVTADATTALLRLPKIRSETSF